jgi:hypothetical protein
MTEDKDPFDGYGYAIRTFWFDAEALKVFRGWGDENEAKIEKRIQGDGIAELDSVHIIGTNTKTSRFDVSIRSNEMAAEEWKRAKSDYIAIRGADGIGENKVTKHLDIINQHCDEKPPSAHLGYTETDEEIGITAGWWCQIMVPNVVLEQLEQDIASGMVNKISIGIEWIGGLVIDEHAPPAAYNIWGLLSKKADGKWPEVMRGYVTSIGWNVAKSAFEQKEAALAEPVEDEPKPDATAQAVAAMSQEISALSRRVYTAFAIAAVVIVIAYLLR